MKQFAAGQSRFPSLEISILMRSSTMIIHFQKIHLPVFFLLFKFFFNILKLFTGYQDRNNLYSIRHYIIYIYGIYEIYMKIIWVWQLLKGVFFTQCQQFQDVSGGRKKITMSKNVNSPFKAANILSLIYFNVLTYKSKVITFNNKWLLKMYNIKTPNIYFKIA